MDPIIITHRLDAGQCLTLRLPRGSSARLLEGRLRAGPPATWLAEAVQRRIECWQEGDGPRALEAGTWVWQAETTCVLALARPARWSVLGWSWRRPDTAVTAQGLAPAAATRAVLDIQRSG